MSFCNKDAPAEDVRLEEPERAEDVSQVSSNRLKMTTDEPPAIAWRVRAMRHGDIERCLEIWLQVELTEARVTVANFLTIDPDGFYVAELESTGKVVGMCSAVMARHDTAFVGFYAVAPEYQGMGIGRELWSRTMARFDDSIHNIGLYGVPSMSEKYKKSGFKVEDTIRMLIFESEPAVQLQTYQLKCLNDLLNDDPGCSLRIELISGEQTRNEEMLDKLIDYDEAVNNNSREKVLRNYLVEANEVPLTIALVRQVRSSRTGDFTSCSQVGTERKTSCSSNGPSRVAIGEEILSASVKSSLSISEITSGKSELQSQSFGDSGQESEFSNNLANELDDTRLLGYGCIRHDNTGGAMIGPLYAQSDAACEVILRQLIERFNINPGGKYSVMSLTSNKQADVLLRQIGLQEMDQCSRMFTKFIPEASLDQIYYVHSPNFTLF